MQRGFGGTTFEPVQPERRERELTLGPFMLLLIGCGLFALCGLCFVFGYSVGHRNAETSSTISVPPHVTPALAQSGNPQAKPTAGQSGYQAPPPAIDATETGTSADADSGSATPQAAPSGTAAASSSDSGVRTVSATQASPSGTVQPALSTSSGSIVVQIAAVTHPEDADVLVGALRKRGYAVASHRDPTDGLLHVQIGPFANRNDAYAMRQKLLNDGYNAIVQP